MVAKVLPLQSNATPIDPALQALPLDGYSRWPDLSRLVPLSRESIRQREIAGRFPRRVQLGSQRCVAWPNREIHRWLADPANYRAEG
ncbi:helix-turn-helix transcriptional regulator [Burkholderia cenocepacia]|uniref:Transcriptional regulator n=1 Tax=Burkholderia cenocepacia TaxID=95486 RepID=A0AAD0J9E1_9BURK|nr:AlpA family phage regulatory protein [Burkholderia cenocepacia]AWG33573.1 transcriptional regulator [Burkholderia cenocepacia]PRE33890.1 transcriptional regulator [Burkholderia cenocepacia]HEM7884003.1 AlpA family phage regulatory protein [Burkholderia cenocepacia]